MTLCGAPPAQPPDRTYVCAGRPDPYPDRYGAKARVASVRPARVATISCAGLGASRVGSRIAGHSPSNTRLARHRPELGLTARIAYLAELTAAYRHALDNGRNLTFPQVHEMQVRGQQFLRELLAVVASRFYDASDPDQRAALKAFLQPLMRETELYRTRRAKARARSEKDALDPDASDEPGDLNPPETPETPDTPGLLDEPKAEPASEPSV